METRSKVFAVAITVIILIVLTVNVVSAGPPGKGSVKTPVEQETEPDPPEPYSHGPYKVKLDPPKSMAFPEDRVLDQISYDDAVAENAYYMYDALNGFAVRFTPPSCPSDIISARFCFWPDGTHEQFAVYVYDDDGPDGEPKTPLGGPIYHTATEGGWCTVNITELGITIADGDFYILYQQLVDGPDCEALCYDETPPIYGRSWDYDGTANEWYIEENDNYMIRCVVNDSNAGSANWTFMVYLDGDNNLESAGIADFMEMSSVNTSSDVNIVVQFDRIPGYDSSYGDWTDCKRFHVTSGMTPTVANAISDLGECNMGDPNTLADFVTWATNYFPADNYALILWNHGSGWKKWVPWDDPEVKRGVCYDDTSGGDYLTLQETGDALTGKYVDLLGYDACLMHMVEVVYQVMANAGISVGSEDLEPGAGWPYDTILADLNATPTMTPQGFGTVIVQRYMDSYYPATDETQSAVNNSDFAGLVTAIDSLAEVLIAEINAGHVADVQQARIATVQIHYDYYIDLYRFAQKIEIEVPSAESEAQAVMDNMDIAVYEEAHGSLVPHEHGLSIYFPLTQGAYLDTYDSTAFADDTNWDEFLKKYYNPPTEGGAIAVFRNGWWFIDTDGDCKTNTYFWFGTTGDVPVVGDFNGDGIQDYGIFRAGPYALWFIDTTGNQKANICFWFGTTGDVPVVGDFNGDKIDDYGIFRNGEWFIDTTGNQKANMRFWFGTTGDVPVVGDFNGDGSDDYGIFRAGPNALWLIDTTGDHNYNLCFWFGTTGDVPVVGDFTTGDGIDDYGVFRNGRWYIDTNFDQKADLKYLYGTTGDQPLVYGG